MPAARRDQILPLAVGGAAAAALGMVPLHRLPRPVQVAYVLVPAVLTATITYAAEGARSPRQVDGTATTPLAQAPARTPASASAAEDAQPTDGESSRSQPWFARFGLSVGLGAVVAGGGVAAIRIDHRVENALRSRGVPSPRLVIGLATGVLTVASVAIDDSGDSEG
ncbi:hypothetical protein [Brachybacterium fresconis]|uniref:DUF3180 domain-containing protein n=1 Tax=Brachybacterium fresconis TaxID=173363 RepID=A0ABS4YEP6_9MICO|nr:hypothetical protein [Brachybacterium fresconis]MBP2407249.1 hypothetical protein [Brachybacterium fresconis]